MLGVPYVIYNKGPEKLPGYTSVDIPNVGAEGMAFVHHIIENVKPYLMFVSTEPPDSSCPQAPTKTNSHGLSQPTEPRAVPAEIERALRLLALRGGV